MKITKHISFFFLENRIVYINRIINETNKYEYTTDLFIHTNNVYLNKDMLEPYINGQLVIIYHDLSFIHPFFLTWKCRELLYQQRNDYDIFIYIEDDILIPFKAINYWLKYNEQLIEKKYNLGFVRIEIDENGIEYITDLFGEKMDTIIHLDGTTYCVNNKNPYCACWIYNKGEFNRFVNSPYYNINNIVDYGIRESSAIGLHGLKTDWYKHTLIPIVNNKLIDDCKVYHMPNNYVCDHTTLHGSIAFDDAISEFSEFV
jgi:hypothetical protein